MNIFEDSSQRRINSADKKMLRNQIQYAICEVLRELERDEEGMICVVCLVSYCFSCVTKIRWHEYSYVIAVLLLFFVTWHVNGSVTYR